MKSVVTTGIKPASSNFGAKLGDSSTCSMLERLSKIDSFTTSYQDGAANSDEVNVYVVFENEKTDSELTTLKSIIDTARSTFDPTDAKHKGEWDYLIT